MRVTLRIFFTAVFIFSVHTGRSQGTTVRDENRDVIAGQSGQVTEAKDNPGKKDDQQDKNPGKQKVKVKQVKSARPDMSKSRGARPPDIVRPSGSRMPKGVGRPAGAMKHGR
jgi:hypothetical protein